MLKAIRDFLDSTLSESDNTAGDTREHGLQLATTALLIEMSRSDADVSEIEEKAIARIVRERFSLEDAELDKLLSKADARADEVISLYEFTRSLNDHLTMDEKVHVVEMLWQVAWADERIDKYEDYLVRKVAELLYVPHPEFIKAKLRVTGE